MSERMNAMRMRIRRLKTLPVLPTLLTAGNLACGITAILCAAHDMLELGAIMVFAAMVCDMLDGKVARLTKTEGPFGAELDSLSDVVSFGVAPAILVHRLVLGSPGVFDPDQRILWFVTVFYPVMAAIRLARYNVEHSDGPTPHFRGIPSPGAAAVVCSWILFQNHQNVIPTTPIGVEYTFVNLVSIDLYRWIVVGLSLLSALLMVSTVHYPHVGNTLLGRVSFRSIISALLLIALFVYWPYWFLVVGTTGYLVLGLLGEVVSMWRRWRRGHSVLDDEEDDDAEDAGLGGEHHIHEGPAPGR
jgi:CDP-diacylglycerol--serine O-phosphatidyltransferase